MSNRADPVTSAPKAELEIDPENVRNANVRRVAVAAQQEKKQLEADPNTKIHGKYSEAYQGESA